MADYTFLVNDIKEACENEGTEFLDYIPKMVNRAEERLTKDLDDYGLVSYTSVAVGDRIVTLPNETGTVITTGTIDGITESMMAADSIGQNELKTLKNQTN